jgi:NADH-quinone oxidoreductase subunit G
MDSLASSVSLGIANNKIMRIVPVLDEAVNEEWLTNKARFAFDSLTVQRLNYPKLRLNTKLMVIS